MSSRPLCIAQISDLHIKPPGVLAYGRVDTAKALERCVAALNEFDPAPDLVVISGDLADTPTADEYRHLKQLLAPLKLPFAGIPGNHDARELMRAAFPSARYAFAAGALNQKIEVGELDLILLELQRAGKAARHARCSHAAMARANPGFFGGSTRAIVPAPSAVRGRHLAYGPSEVAQCRSTRIDRQTSSARASRFCRPRSPGGVDGIRGNSGHDLSGAEPCRGSRSCRIA